MGWLYTLSNTRLGSDPLLLVPASPLDSYLTPSLVFDLCFVDSLRKKRDLIVKLESEGWPYEELRGRAPPNLPDGYDGYNTLNAFFAVALLGILIPMALQRCV